jgi:Helix-turn-helix domain
MAVPARYYDLVREMKDAYNHRLRLVESARQRGIKPTARLFATTAPSVRKWVRRYRQPRGSCLRRATCCFNPRSRAESPVPPPSATMRTGARTFFGGMVLPGGRRAENLSLRIKQFGETRILLQVGKVLVVTGVIAVFRAQRDRLL